MKNKHDIIWLDTVDSTNSEAKRRILKIDNLSVVSALSQTAGRGQAGNTWESADGENLTFSIILKPSEHGPGLKACDQFIISQITSVSIVEFLKCCGIEAEIKWPNDIYVRDRKICGILIEHSLKADEIYRSIIGIGLNINQRNFNVTLPNPTSVFLEKGLRFNIYDMLEELMRIFRNNWYNYIDGSARHADICHSYLDLLWRKDKPYRYIDRKNECEFTGIIRGTGSFGHLIIEKEKGELEEFAFKEISYII